LVTPAARLVYCDEDRIAEGRRFEPHFKPDFSRELFRSYNYLGALVLHHADHLHALGGWREGFDGAEQYDLNLRACEGARDEAVVHIPHVLVHRQNKADLRAGREPADASEAGLRALEEHVARTGLGATVEPVPGTRGYRLRLPVPKPEPRVSLIVPTRDRVELLRGCVESIREKTTYTNYEIIVVDNGSHEAATLSYLDELAALPDMRVLSYREPFNYSAINNFAAARAEGSIIGLINNDIVAITPDWLTEMVGWALLPDVGCVGAKLYYADGTVQHGGVILGLGGIAGHAHRGFPRDHPGYFSRLKLTQNLTAVTGACLIVRREIFEEVGGLNERDLTVAYNDVDFCLRVREAGYTNVWTPFAELYHLESVSRGAEDSPEKLRRYQSEMAYMQQNWILNLDPYYSVNLTLDREDFSFAQ